MQRCSPFLMVWAVMAAIESRTGKMVKNSALPLIYHLSLGFEVKFSWDSKRPGEQSEDKDNDERDWSEPHSGLLHCY